MLTVLIFFVPLISALRVRVTRLQCGKSYNITRENEIYLDYENFKMELFEQCVIQVTNDNFNKMICIKNEGPYIDVDCALHLMYKTGDTKEYSLYDGSCSSFMTKPRCDRTSKVSVLYRNSHSNDAKVNVKLYTMTYVAPTTSKPWSSWSSSYDDSYGDDDDSNSAGTIIGIVVGLFVTIVLIICCVCAKATQTTRREPQYAPTVQYTAQNGNRSNMTTSAHTVSPNQSGFQQPQRFTSNPPSYEGYHVHAPVIQHVPNQSPSTEQLSNNKPEVPPPNYEEPPPPYPGY